MIVLPTGIVETESDVGGGDAAMSSSSGESFVTILIYPHTPLIEIVFLISVALDDPFGVLSI